IGGRPGRSLTQQRRRYLWLRPRGEQAEAEPLRKITRGQLPFDAVARLAEPRSEGAESPPARRGGHESAAYAALSRQSDIVKPVSRRFVQARRRHDRQSELAAFRIDQALPGQRVDAAVGECRAHHGKILRCDTERTLPRIKLDRVCRLDGDLLA